MRCNSFIQSHFVCPSGCQTLGVGSLRSQTEYWMLKHKTTCRVTCLSCQLFPLVRNRPIGDVQAFGDSLQFHRIEGVFPPVVRGALQVQRPFHVRRHPAHRNAPRSPYQSGNEVRLPDIHRRRQKTAGQRIYETCLCGSRQPSCATA